MDGCFEYALTVTPPTGGANGVGIVMPRLTTMEKKTTADSALELELWPVIPSQVMTAMRSGETQGREKQFLYLHITAWKQHFNPNGRHLDWYGPNAVPDEIRHVLRYGGYPTGPYISRRPMRVTDPGLYMVTFTQMFMGMRLELTVMSQVTQSSEGDPPSVGLATCAIYGWRNSTFGDVIPLRQGEQNCIRCVASSSSPLRLTFAKQLFQSDVIPAGYRRLPVDVEQRMGDGYTSLRYNVDNPSESDVGWYVCGATNKYGTTTRTFRIDVIEHVKMLSVEPSIVVLQGDGQVYYNCK
jgi:hypothetical protein